MKHFKIKIFFCLIFSLNILSCSHQEHKVREVASKGSLSCWDKIKGEYQTYFDSVETCLENQGE